MMQSLPNHRNYGLIIAAAILCSLLWVTLDNQASSSQPGLLAPLRRHVWCHTIVKLPVNGDEEGTRLILNHYPGKKLTRVMEDFGVSQQAIQTLTKAEKETVCFTNWRDATLKDLRFGQMIEGYEDIVMAWPEEMFKEAILTLTFQPNGEEMLQATLYRLAEQQQQGATSR